MPKELPNVLLQPTDVVTINGRIYPKEVMEKAIAAIKKPSLLGTFSLRSPVREMDFLTIKLDEVSHEVKNLRMTDRGVVGDITVLDLPMGAVLQKFISDETPYSFGMRSLIEYEGEYPNSSGEPSVVSKCQIISFDICDLCPTLYKKEENESK